MHSFAKDHEMALLLARKAAEQNGRAYYVGGFVRDALMGRENKDIDIEVHGLSPAQLEAVLDSLGEKMTFGESFGIYGLKGYSIDIAMPRREKLRGRGHRDFDVFVDPFIGTHKAAMRRDFTINAMMQDVLTGDVVDHFGGRADLQKGVIRHVNDESFAEDPLRVFRAAQFAARFGFAIADETIHLCSGMDVSALSHERVEAELQKALLQAERPSIFFEVLRQMNQLHDWFPELEALIGIPQDPRHHAEGDVWTHTMMVLDQAAQYRSRAANPIGLMLAAVTHDFGKAVCTEEIDGRIHAYLHEVKGLPLAESFLRRLTNEVRLIEYVLNLTEHHMKPIVSASAGASVKSTNHLFDKAIDPDALIWLAVADDLGRIAPRNAVAYDCFLLERLAVYRQTMAQPYVMGRDLIENGLKPGPDFGDILAYAHKLRLAGISRENALRQTLAYARTQRKKGEVRAKNM